MLIRPYRIIPKLIPKPTWGGDYIVDFKNLNHPFLDKHKIGQSFELSQHTHCSIQEHADSSLFEIASDTNPIDSQIFGDCRPIISLSDLIKSDPSAILGENGLNVYGQKMGVLIKFTQSKGNSYQLHVHQNTDKWKIKPESWYYFEPGLITLGVKPLCNWLAYRQICEQILQLSVDISQKITSGQMTLSSAIKTLENYISLNNPEQFVNKIAVPKNSALDLSSGGIHHSWEEDSINYPLGNVLYEVQKNAYDSESTIRNFDKGKFNSDGSIRDLQIEEYFNHIDRSEVANTPTTHFTEPKMLEKSATFSATQIFDNEYYRMQELSFSGQVSNDFTTTNHTFHHLFIKSGTCVLTSDSATLHLDRGASAFIPAALGKYQLSGSKETIVFKTYL